ncbi:MAG TPA: hypothetical protein VE994_10035 [Terriglobales bacterium]|nr:hypothetical protein [Terriglobales bacterium]
MSKRTITAALVLAGALILPFCFGAAAKGRPAKDTKMSSRMVYVCSCMKTKSCPCMTEANMEGHCACGMKSPEMKAVPRNSAWARTNRKALRGGSANMKM